MLKRRRRVGAGTDALGDQRLESLGTRVHETVDREPGPPPTTTARLESPLQMLVRLEEEACPAAALRDRSSSAEVRPQESQVELGLVDCVLRLLGGRPANHRRTARLRPAAELIQVRQPSLGAAEHVERVQRRHPGASLHQVDPGIGHDQPTTRRANGETEQQLLPPGAALVSGQAITGLPERLAALVEQQRVFARAPREHAFRQARNEHQIEASPSRFLDAAHEDAAESPLRRLVAAETQPLSEDPLHFGKSDLVDLRQGSEFGQHFEHRLRAPQRHRREFAEAFEPQGPVGPLRQFVQEPDQGQRKGLERLQAVDLALQVGPVSVILIPYVTQAQPELSAQTLETLRPALGAADDGGIDQQPFPLGRDTERTGRSGVFPGTDVGLASRCAGSSGVRAIFGAGRLVG